MTRKLVRTVAGSLLAVSAAAVTLGGSPGAAVTLGGSPGAAVTLGGSPGAAVAQVDNDDDVVACRAMTDSIVRLYDAYFGRTPDAAGLDHWITSYQTGAMSLEDISTAFARSSEFDRLTQPSNLAFVNWLYDRVEGDAVSPDRQQHWVRALDAGYPRGLLMLLFSESDAHAAATSTLRPMAGYGHWYPDGAHWYCGRGTQTIRVNPLEGEVWADYFIDNRSRRNDDVEIWTHEALGRRHLRIVAHTLPPAGSDYDPDGSFTGDGSYGRYLEVVAGTSTEWLVVFYPRSIGSDRPGWQLAP
jgi:hypothetical protein